MLGGDAVAPQFLAHRIRGHGPDVGGEFIPFVLEIAEEVALAAVETSLKIAPAACKAKPEDGIDLNRNQECQGRVVLGSREERLSECALDPAPYRGGYCQDNGSPSAKQNPNMGPAM